MDFTLIKKLLFFPLGIAPWTLSAPTVSLFLFRSKHTNDYIKNIKKTLI